VQLCVFDEWRIGVRTEAGIADVTDALGFAGDPLDRMRFLIERWQELGERIRHAAAGAPLVPEDAVRFRPPVPRPSKIVAAPVNYRRHQEEMGGESGVYGGVTIGSIDEYGAFLKAPSSLLGAGGKIRLPYLDRRIDHEGEVGVVIGREAHGVAAADALDFVFGYVPLMDITLRGGEDRSFRKSFDTFTPLGPAIVTADEVGDAGELGLQLRVNGELRQDANTRDLIYGVPRLIERISGVMTLLPGDIVATGTPEGVGPIEPGDEVVLTIERVGTLRVGVSGPD
jgi:2-keto-4-pentenoate hydratase/2-oxohepta-3-ene-1,7-dioic acid hydratase in catechol pathway